MPSTVLVGTQWGDEGKGKICDLIAGNYDSVVRFQGGNNAGHTIVVGDKKYGLHQVPSGIMYPECVSVIGNGCVVNPAVLLEEIDMFEADGISTANLKVSGNAHVIMPYHMDLDGAYEALLGDHNIGTTRRGIGPCYQDKMARIGIRMQDLLDEGVFRDKLARVLDRVNPQLEKIFGCPPTPSTPSAPITCPWPSACAPTSGESGKLLNELVDAGKTILSKARMATLLDIDYGTYPYVTSSNCTAGGAVTGSGVGMKNVDRVLGVMKAYITRVGSGPMPTELAYETSEGRILTEQGYEYGVTTGRRRRCGWFDGVIARYSARVNGLTHLALTKPGRALGVRYHQDLRRLRCGRRALYHGARARERVRRRGARLRGDARLELRHLAMPHLRRAAGARPGVRGAHRGARRRAGRLRLGGSGPRADHRA